MQDRAAASDGGKRWRERGERDGRRFIGTHVVIRGNKGRALKGEGGGEGKGARRRAGSRHVQGPKPAHAAAARNSHDDQHVAGGRVNQPLAPVCAQGPVLRKQGKKCLSSRRLSPPPLSTPAHKNRNSAKLDGRSPVLQTNASQAAQEAEKRRTLCLPRTCGGGGAVLRPPR